jgi:SAM-dependent methyltransferase
LNTSKLPENDELAANDIRFHEATATNYDRDVTRNYRIYHAFSLYPFLDSKAQSRHGGRVLDLGVGTGVVSLALAERGFFVTGVDHSPAMLAVARTKALERGLDNRIELQLGDVRALGFPDASFDGVTCQGLLHHLGDFENCLMEAARVLRPGGFLYISEPTVDATVLRRGFSRVALVVRALARRPLKQGYLSEGIDTPIASPRLLAALDALDFAYDVEFLTHLPHLWRFLPDGPRLALTKLVSRPWQRHRGDLIFVYAHRRTSPPLLPNAPG